MQAASQIDRSHATLPESLDQLILTIEYASDRIVRLRIRSGVLNFDDMCCGVEAPRGDPAVAAKMGVVQQELLASGAVHRAAILAEAGREEEAVGSGQWLVGSRQWAVGSGQWAVGSRQWAVGSRQSPKAEHFPFVIGHWSLVIFHFPFLNEPLIDATEGEWTKQNEK
jgi:hypothetical protein